MTPGRKSRSPSDLLALGLAYDAMKWIFLLGCFLLTNCGSGAIRAEATKAFEDLTEFASFNVMNTGTVPLAEVRFFHLVTGEVYYLGHPLWPIETTPPVPPLFGEMRDIRVGLYQIEMTHLVTGTVEIIQHEIVFGPVVLELEPHEF